MPGTMSVKGLFDYDNTLFNGMVIPSAMNKNALINYILMECSDLEILVTDPDTLKTLIESWSLSRKHSWERLYESTIQQYNMIHNYDRYEDWTDTGTGTGTGKNTSQLNKAAYNRTDPIPVEKQQTDATSTTNTRDVHSGHMYGNIGVTSSQDMILAERNVDNYDVYQAITDEFKNKFCICVY